MKNPRLPNLLLNPQHGMHHHDEDDANALREVDPALSGTFVLNNTD